MEARHIYEYSQPIESEVTSEYMPPQRGLLKCLGRIGVGKVTGETRMFADEMVVTQGAKLRPAEDFIGVVANAQAQRDAIQRLREQRRGSAES